VDFDRPLKEWFVAGAGFAESWLPLAKEDLSFIRKAQAAGSQRLRKRAPPRQLRAVR